MSRLLQVLGLVVCVLLVGSVANAAETSVSDLVQAPTGYFLPADQADYKMNAPWYRYDDTGNGGDWGWTHTWTAPEDNLGILSATLAIDAYDIDDDPDITFPEVDLIYGDGILLGTLTGVNSDWAVATLNLTGSALDALADGELDVWMDIDSTNPGEHVWAVTLRTSTLNVTYQMPDEPPPGVPVPGAVLLGSIGVGMVGWLRRRSTL